MREKAQTALVVVLSLLLLAPPGTLAGGDKKDVSKIGKRDVGGGINLYSLEREIALGKQLAQRVEQSARLVDDPVVLEYVDGVAQTLVRNSDARVPFTVKVIDSSEINAFALPGGFFFINSGLILAADEEAELAGVMAHEIAHVTARHGTKNATKAQIAQWAMIPLIILGPAGWAGYGIYQGLSFGLPLAFLKFSRNAEREADFLGLQYMYKAGYDPTSFITFFEKIRERERKRPGSIPKIFSSHPPTKERVARAQKEIAQLLPAREQYVVTTSEFEQIKRRLALRMAGRKLEQEESDRPTLRGRERREEKKKKEQQEEDKPPVLKRRP
ncbi:MAG: M48 family metallopeptidase [Terriglobia bacterium]